MTKGYHNYRGRGGRQKRLLAVVLVLVILAATAFLVIQNYIVYDDAGKAHIEWPFRKDEPQPDDNATPPVSQDDVNIDYVDNGYAPHLQELHAQMLPGNALRQAPETVLADLTEQRSQLDAAIQKLTYKVSRYEAAVRTGVLSWTKETETD